MKKKISPLFFSLILFSSIFYFITSVTVTAHTDWSILHGPHEPITCKLDSERELVERTICRDKIKRHKMCKLDQYCAILRLEKLEEIIRDLEKKIKDQKPV